MSTSIAPTHEIKENGKTQFIIVEIGDLALTAEELKEIEKIVLNVPDKKS